MYFLITNALLPHGALLPVAARPAAGGTGGAGRGCAGRGQPPQPRGGAEPGGGSTAATEAPARRETPPSGPSWQRRGFGDPKGIPPRPSPPCRGFRPPCAAGSLGAGRAAVPLRPAMPGSPSGAASGAAARGGGGGSYGPGTERDRGSAAPAPPSRAKPAGSGHRPAPAVAAPAPPAGDRCMNECLNE